MCVSATRIEPIDADADAYLAARFPAGAECDWCFEGAQGHEVVLDRYGNQVVQCISDNDADLWAPGAARAYYRRQIGWLP